MYWKFACLLTSLIVISDFLVTFILYTRLELREPHVIGELISFNIYSSTVEFVFMSFIRLIITTGFIIGLSHGLIMDATYRLTKISPLIQTLLVVMWTYTIVKMLIYTEMDHADRLPFWFWLQFSWSHVAILLSLLSFKLLQSSKPTRSNRRPLNVNGTEEEREELLEENKDTGKKASSILRLLHYSKPDWIFLLTAMFFMVISAVSEIFTPWYTGKVIQYIAIDKSREKFTQAIIFMTLFSVLSTISAGIRGGLFKVAMARFNIRIRNILFSSIVNQDIGFFDATKTGEITSRLTSDAGTMSDALSLNLNIFLRSIIKAIGVCVFMFRLSWRLSMVTIVGLPIIMTVSKLYGDYYKNLSKKVQDSLASANEVAEEVCSSMKTIRSFANESGEASRYADNLALTFGLNIKEAYAYAGYMWCNQLFSLSLVVFTLYYGGHLVITEMMEAGNLVSFILYQMELGYALESISGVYSGLMQAVGASIKVFEYIDRVPAFPLGGNVMSDSVTGDIQFKDVTFAYPSRPDATVLKGISFHISAGEVVALVGQSGGGKSSCINLLEHFYEPISGEILLDGLPINSYDHKFLHKKISLVGQEPVLFGRSLKENISYGLYDTDCDDADVMNAATMANAHSFIQNMKEAYETQAGEKGAQLSGGQKQRIALARAIIRRPVVLLLDEATSALDSESEHLVQQALYRNMNDRTVIIVAHRLSTVERADRIIVIKEGELVEQGTHKQLISNPDSLYRKLVRRQIDDTCLLDKIQLLPKVERRPSQTEEMAVDEDLADFWKPRSSISNIPSKELVGSHSPSNSPKT